MLESGSRLSRQHHNLAAMAAHDTTRPDLAELKRAALNKVAKLRASQAAPAPSSPSPSHGGFADGTTNDTVRLLIQEKNELLTALEEERARVARLESEAIASSTQVQEAGTADALKTLEEENKGLKAEMDILSSKLRGLEAAMQTAEVQRAAANDQLLDKEREWAAALADMETRTAQTLETLEQRLVDSGRHVEALGNESQGLKDNLAAARRERDEALERTSTLEKSVEMLETKVRNMTVGSAVAWETGIVS